MNLALLPPEERMAMDADRIACLFRYYRKMKDWRAWVQAELEKLPEPMRQPVKDALNRRLKDDR